MTVENIVLNNGTNSFMINAQFDTEILLNFVQESRLNFFRLRVDLDFGVGRKWVDNVTGYGILFGKNAQLGKLALLIGGFQYYDYWDNKTFELGDIGFGGGVLFPNGRLRKQSTYIPISTWQSYLLQEIVPDLVLIHRSSGIIILADGVDGKV